MYVIFNQTLQLQPINTGDFFFYKFSKCEKDLIFRMSNCKNANAGNIFLDTYVIMYTCLSSGERATS